MFSNFERNFWAFASAMLSGAVAIGILRNSAGLTAGGKAATDFLVGTTKPFLEA